MRFIQEFITRSLLLCLLFTTITGCTQHSNQRNSQIPPAPPVPDNLTAIEKVTTRALNSFYNDWRGTPYKYGGMSSFAVDCSGLTTLAFKEIFGVRLPRTTSSQASIGKEITKNKLRSGDLVFFKTGISQKHVGIYLHSQQFLHASTSKGVIISRLDSPYWSKHYWKANRVYNL